MGSVWGHFDVVFGRFWSFSVTFFGAVFATAGRAGSCEFRRSRTFFYRRGGAERSQADRSRPERSRQLVNGASVALATGIGDETNPIEANRKPLPQPGMRIRASGALRR